MNQELLVKQKAYFVVSFIDDEFFNVRMYDEEEYTVVYQTAIIDLGGKAYTLPHDQEIFKTYADTFSYDVYDIVLRECARQIREHNIRVLKDFV